MLGSFQEETQEAGDDRRAHGQAAREEGRVEADATLVGHRGDVYACALHPEQPFVLASSGVAVESNGHVCVCVCVCVL